MTNSSSTHHGGPLGFMLEHTYVYAPVTEPVDAPAKVDPLAHASRPTLDVLKAIVHRYNQNGRINIIALWHLTGLKMRTVRKIVNRLLDAGWLDFSAYDFRMGPKDGPLRPLLVTESGAPAIHHRLRWMDRVFARTEVPDG